MNHAHHEPHTPEELQETLHEHDEWFRHTPDEPRHHHAHGTTQARLILLFLIGTLVVVFGTTMAVLVVFDQLGEGIYVENKERRTPTTQIASFRAEWQRQLSEFSPVEGAPGRARIPLELAQRLVVEDYSRNAPAGSARMPSR